MSHDHTADGLDRLLKQLLDSGKATCIEDAKAIFNTYRVHLVIDEKEAGEVSNQILLLTAVALGSRAFHGGVTVSGFLETALLAPLPLGKTLSEAIVRLGGLVAEQEIGIPTIFIGGPSRERKPGFQIRAICSGWRGGIVPAHKEGGMERGETMPLAAMLSAALAVNEAFFHVQGASPEFGMRKVGMSLWDPSNISDWSNNGSGEVSLRYLPKKLWLLGLGHLGQAYAWGLSVLPYPGQGELCLTLQDIDRVTKSTTSTSVLSWMAHVGSMKTRVLAGWCEARGFEARLIERRFDETFRRKGDEPSVAICGFDNSESRCAMENAGFSYIVEAGLGQGHQDFRTMQIHTLPTNRSFEQIWGRDVAPSMVAPMPAYQKWIDEGVIDQCGFTQLAGKAVGAPFVGSVAACLVLSAILRQLHAGRMYDLISLDLTDISRREAVGHSMDFASLSPEFIVLPNR